MSPLTLTSRIHRVVVHARGAVVTRSVTLPESLEAETCTFVIPDITPFAEPATFRAIAKGSRQIVSVLPKLVVPEGPAKLGSAAERLQTLEAERVALCDERGHLTGRRNQLAGIQFDLGLQRRFQRANAGARIADGLAMTRLVQDELAALDERIRKLEQEISRVEKAVEAARIAEAQARSAERESASRPTIACHVQLESGQTLLEALEIEYVVQAARFWPTYKAWLTKGATQVRLELDALVVQDSGEDWTNVEMALSTADLIRDARLPELPSLRFGRATPPQKRGYRAPPVGLDAMFESYDIAMVKMVAEAPAPKARSAPPPPQASFGAPPPPPGAFGPPPAPALLTMVGSVMPSSDSASMSMREEEIAAKPRAKLEKAKGGGGRHPDAARSFDGAMPPPQGKPPPRPTAMPKSPGPIGGAAPAKKVSYDMMEAEEDEGGGFGDELSSVGPVEPDDAWLDFDSLTLPGGDKPRRGKLTRAPDDSTRHQAEHVRLLVNGMSSPARTKDPYVYRGLFDYCYEAVGRADVPSNRRPHRVHVQAADGPAKPRFRTVPRESTDIFREALIENPMGAPLCAGPMDVFLDGALLTTTESAAVDRGGVFVVGLGVEDRVRIARNARIEESTAGLLGGSTHVDHHVTVDITSSLGMPVHLEVLERIPVTDDKDVSVKITSAEPEAEVYDQSDLGSPVRGGRRFRIEVPPGGKAKVAFGYRVKLPAKSEIVGGNRRE